MVIHIADPLDLSETLSALEIYNPEKKGQPVLDCRQGMRAPDDKVTEPSINEIDSTAKEIPKLTGKIP